EGALWLLGQWDAVLACSHPYVLVNVRGGDGGRLELLRRLGVFGFLWGSVAVCFVALAAWRLRAVYLRQMEQAGMGLVESATDLSVRPPVGDNPFYWREVFVEGAARPGVFRAIPRWLIQATIALLTAAGAVAGLTAPRIGPPYGSILHVPIAAAA